MSIAQSIVELAEDVAEQENADSIQSIDIEIGTLFLGMSTPSENNISGVFLF